MVGRRDEEKEKEKKPVQVLPLSGLVEIGPKDIRTFHPKLGQEPPCKIVARRKDTVMRRIAGTAMKTDRSSSIGRKTSTTPKNRPHFTANHPQEPK